MTAVLDLATLPKPEWTTSTDVDGSQITWSRTVKVDADTAGSRIGDEDGITVDAYRTVRLQIEDGRVVLVPEGEDKIYAGEVWYSLAQARQYAKVILGAVEAMEAAP
jgi:hypothetical protein